MANLTAHLLLVIFIFVVMVTAKPEPFIFSDACSSTPCKNGGKCSLTIFGFECTCAHGWKGKTCTQKVLPCELHSPCKNGAKCVNKGANDFECTCAQRFQGPTCEEKVKCKNPLDVLFIIDGSLSNVFTEQNFDSVKTFVAAVSDWLEISKTGANVGVLEFSAKDKTQIKIFPQSYLNAVALKNAIASIKPNLGTGGAMGEALKLANDQIFPENKHPNAAKAIVLVTDAGIYFDDESRMYQEAAKLKGKGVKIITISVAELGYFLFKGQLEKVSSPLKPIESKYDKVIGLAMPVSALLCSFTKNPCDSNFVCQNGGKCSYDRDSTFCLCGRDFKGVHCEELVEPCKSSPCKNGGACENIDDDKFTCNCLKGWKGKTCDEKVKPCESSPCKNGGTCENIDDDKFACNCSEGWIGKTCDEKVMSECFGYSWLTDSNRNKNDNSKTVLCDKSLSTRWYRFGGSAGIKMPTSCVPKNRCGTHASGWMKGAHPSVSDSKVTRTVCYHWENSCCRWSNSIEVINCGSYYVYKLSPSPVCHLRYCGTS